MPQIAPGRLVRYAQTRDLTQLVTPPYAVIDDALPASASLRELDVVRLNSLVLEDVLGMSRQSQERQEHLVSARDAQVAESGEVMPQKSTFFHPRIIDGLGVQLLDGEPVGR